MNAKEVLTVDTVDCKCYSKGLNYIIWRLSVNPGGIFIIHIGGTNKRELYRMMQELFRTTFQEQEIFFCTQRESYWKNNSEHHGRFSDGTEVFKYTGRR